MTTALELEDEYGHWGEHPVYPVADWQYEAANNDTRLGYWEWVSNKIANEDEGD